MLSRQVSLFSFTAIRFVLFPQLATPFLVNTSSKSNLAQGRNDFSTRSSALFAGQQDDDKDSDGWDANVDYEKEWPADEKATSASLDPTSSWDSTIDDDDQPKLGIDIGKGLAPLSEDDASELRDEATAIINDKVSSGIEDINRLRDKMKKELEDGKKAMQFASEMRAKEESKQLLNKIDKLTSDFMKSTESTRESTKLAASASRAMESKVGINKGLEMGSWGTVGGRTVIAGEGLSLSNDGLLGSVENAYLLINKESDKPTNDPRQSLENRIIVIADKAKDPYAKALLPSFLKKFKDSNIPSLQVDVLTPTASMPLGGNDAACVIFFCTSISEASSARNILDRLLRKTLSGTTIGKPPTQLVGISTVGTERTDRFPYSMQNLMGRQLENRRQIEEVLISTVRKRVTEPPLDYTIIKLGDIKNKDKGDFQLRPGDVLDGTITVETAADALVQAIAYQPFARNSTLCVTGTVPENVKDHDPLFWEKAFLCLEGPEILRIDNLGNSKLYGKLVEYIQGWADMLVESGKGLTTPILAQNGVSSSSFGKKLYMDRDGVQILFKPTATGKNYMSRSEERVREKDGQKVRPTNISMRLVREGGVEVVVEVSNDDELLIRARRCNYAQDAVIKEISEATILKRLEEAMDVWRKEIF